MWLQNMFHLRELCMVTISPYRLRNKSSHRSYFLNQCRQKAIQADAAVLEDISTARLL